MKKNTAGQKWRVYAFHRGTSVPYTGGAATITAKIDKDGAGAVATNDANPTEAEDGYYDFDLAQAETNAYSLAILPESSTNGVHVDGCPRTQITTEMVSGVTPSEALRRIGAITSGKISGAGTGTETAKDYAESVNTIVVTVDGSGNRTAITYN